MVKQNGQVNMQIKFVMIAVILTKLKLFYLSLEYWKMSKYSLSALVFKNVFSYKLEINTNYDCDKVLN